MIKQQWETLAGPDMALLCKPVSVSATRATGTAHRKEKEGQLALVIELSPFAGGIFPELEKSLPLRINAQFGEKLISHLVPVAPPKGKEIPEKTEKVQRNAASLMKRRNGLRAIASNLPRITKQATGKRKMAGADILQHWEAIVGKALSSQCLPLKYTPPKGLSDFGSITMKVDPAVAMEIQYQEQVIIEKINRFFGHRAVGKLNLIQGRFTGPEDSKLPQLRQLSGAEKLTIETELSDVPHDRLREAMIRLESTRRAQKPGKK
ncbi:DUF721 domain-containing protein [Kiloniella sp. b19]|uniref:DUF721 domain-containing protein n=1 Tax=Kiloniella sp. GXU_MW_B19 TaxID=3141326 RepID=UPI0031E01460